MNLDAALDLYSGLAPWYAGGLANHGPMAAEALDTLDGLGAGAAAEAAESWSAWYARRLPSLGDAGAGFQRTLARIEGEIAGMGWEPVVHRRLPFLIPDTAAGSAGHGLLRVSHAVRALGRADTPARRRELAHGLAYWTVSWQTFAGPRLPLTGTLDPRTALEQLPPSGVTERGFFTTVLPMVNASADFRAAVMTLAAPDDPAAALGELTEAAARAFVAGGAAEPIALVHAITVPAALRPLMPYLDADDQLTAYGAAWHAVAAFIAGYGSGVAATVDSAATSWRELAEGALTGRDEHAIKLVGACALENAAHRSPVYVTAATVGVAALAGAEVAS